MTEAKAQLREYMPEIIEMRNIMTVVKRTGQMPTGKGHLFPDTRIWD